MWLVLNRYGKRLTCKQGRFQVKNDPQWQRISPHKLEGICIAEPGMISTDAIRLAVRHQLPIILLDRAGKPIGRFWSQYYRKEAYIRRQQTRFAEAEPAGRWMLQQLQRKTQRQTYLLQALAQDKKERKKQKQELIKMQLYADEMQALADQPLPEIKEKVLGLEGNLARVYFALLSQLLPKAYRFESRSRRPAQDVFNCALNYLYGILYGHCEQALIQAGLDPFLPIWHSDRKARPALVYDFVEPYRPWADWICFQLCREEALSEATHTEPVKAGLWLNAAGKKVVIDALENHLNQVPQQEGRKQSRRQQLFAEARSFAREISQYKKQVPDDTPDHL